ncbi:hypothetical protein RIF29_04729 [Crotalaria pallida]|uniref:Uncharacterized protein n=1 Tax=Crotalaria pallida TaxID=3830 RepID=A0AAN9J1B5_CROPI
MKMDAEQKVVGKKRKWDEPLENANRTGDEMKIAITIESVRSKVLEVKGDKSTADESNLHQLFSQIKLQGNGSMQHQQLRKLKSGRTILKQVGSSQENSQMQQVPLSGTFRTSSPFSDITNVIASSRQRIKQLFGNDKVKSLREYSSKVADGEENNYDPMIHSNDLSERRKSMKFVLQSTWESSKCVCSNARRSRYGDNIEVQTANDSQSDKAATENFQPSRADCLTILDANKCTNAHEAECSNARRPRSRKSIKIQNANGGQSDKPESSNAQKSRRNHRGRSNNNNSRCNHNECTALVLTIEQIQTRCLLEIDKHLRKSGKSLNDYPNMPIPDCDPSTVMCNTLIAEQLDFNRQALAEEFETLQQSMTDEQKNAFQQIFQAIETKQENRHRHVQPAIQQNTEVNEEANIPAIVPPVVHPKNAPNQQLLMAMLSSRNLAIGREAKVLHGRVSRTWKQMFQTNTVRYLHVVVIDAQDLPWYKFYFASFDDILAPETETHKKCDSLIGKKIHIVYSCYGLNILPGETCFILFDSLAFKFFHKTAMEMLNELEQVNQSAPSFELQLQTTIPSSTQNTAIV